MEAKVCDSCQRQKADYICALCGADCCKNCKKSPELKLEVKIKRTSYGYATQDIYKMCTFNFCKPCNDKVPWGSKDQMEDETTHQMILDKQTRKLYSWKKTYSAYMESDTYAKIKLADSIVKDKDG